MLLCLLLQSVLRRLRAYACLDTLQSTVGPMLAGKVNALLLAPPEFCTHLQRVAAATIDLATLVLQPDRNRQRASLAAKPPQASGSSSQLPSQQRQEADACVLQLMLGFRALDLLAALVIYIGVHICRLVELQRQLSAGELTGCSGNCLPCTWAKAPRSVCLDSKGGG